MRLADPGRRAAISRVLFGIAFASAIAAVLLVLTGGFTIHPFGLRLSAHGALRPALLCLLSSTLAVRLLPEQRQAQIVGAAEHRMRALLPWIAVIASVTVLALGVRYGARAAGGGDSYGYVSEATLWRQGSLHVPSGAVPDAPWPNAPWTFAPAGYRPAGSDTLVPTYAPGLPILMALSQLAFGACGPYLVNPVCAAALVLLTYGLGARLSGRVTGAVAAAAIASSPAVLFMTMFPMSDVPAAAFWAAALLAACRGTLTGGAISGVLSGIAITVRPNLTPLAVAPALIAAWLTSGRTIQDRLRTTTVFACACAPFILFIAWLNNDLYGSPFQSGYGNTASLFAAAHIADNLARFHKWLWETQGALLFVFPIAVWTRGPEPSALALRRMLLMFIAVVVACYAGYTPFDAWWYLRFVLPAFPVVFALASDVVWSGTQRFGTRVRVVAMIAFACVLVDRGVTQARERGVFSIGIGEQKYADVGRYVGAALPENAIVLAVQHSGSIRYYARRRTLQWEWLDGEWLDRAIEHLRRSGFEPYLVLEESELAAFRQRFASQRAVSLIDRVPKARHARGVRVYGTGAVATATPDVIPHTTGCE
jgi:hypothetical protein